MLSWEFRYRAATFPSPVHPSKGMFLTGLKPVKGLRVPQFDIVSGVLHSERGSRSILNMSYGLLEKPVWELEACSRGQCKRYFEKVLCLLERSVKN